MERVLVLNESLPGYQKDCALTKYKQKWQTAFKTQYIQTLPALFYKCFILDLQGDLEIIQSSATFVFPLCLSTTFKIH